MPPQVAQDHVDADVGTDGDGVRVHQAAGSVLRIGEHFLDPLAVLFVHGVQDFLDHRVRQLLQQVGEVVRLEIFDDVRQFLSVQLAQEVAPDVIAQVLQNLAFEVLFHQVPEQGPLAGGRGFQQVSNITGTQAAVKNTGDLLERTAVERFAQRPQPLPGLAFFQNIGHESPAC